MMLETKRCILMPQQKSDEADIVALNGDAAVRRYLGGPVSAEVIQAAFARGPRSDGVWIIRCTTSRQFIGMVSLSPHIDGADTELSYMLTPTYWGYGYAFEAAQAVLRHGFVALTLPRIIAETQTANVASCRLLERLGMVRLRTLTRYDAEQAIYLLNADALLVEK